MLGYLHARHALLILLLRVAPGGGRGALGHKGLAGLSLQGLEGASSMGSGNLGRKIPVQGVPGVKTTGKLVEPENHGDGFGQEGCEGIAGIGGQDLSPNNSQSVRGASGEASE